jgi:hypothetical protein
MPAAPTQAPTLPEPTTVPALPAPTDPPVASGCDPNYTPCVPISSVNLDCGDIPFSVQIIGSDPHGFDGNVNDGWGCESNQTTLSKKESPPA